MNQNAQTIVAPYVNPLVMELAMGSIGINSVQIVNQSNGNVRLFTGTQSPTGTPTYTIPPNGSVTVNPGGQNYCTAMFDGTAGTISLTWTDQWLVAMATSIPAEPVNQTNFSAEFFSFAGVQKIGIQANSIVLPALVSRNVVDGTFGVPVNALSEAIFPAIAFKLNSISLNHFSISGIPPYVIAGIAVFSRNTGFAVGDAWLPLCTGPGTLDFATPLNYAIFPGSVTVGGVLENNALSLVLANLDSPATNPMSGIMATVQGFYV